MPIPRWLSEVVRASRRLVPRPALTVTAVHTYEDYVRHERASQADYARRTARERALAAGGGGQAFSVPGFCYVCGRRATFDVDYLYSAVVDGQPMPNWREWLQCRRCLFSNRLRATLHVLETVCRPQPSSAIYITEQVTTLYAVLARRYTGVVGSEFLGDRLPAGACDARGIRNESITALTFDDKSFDIVLSFEVLEHVPDYPAALAEVFRVLRPSGWFLFTAPFRLGSPNTIVRASIDTDGKVTHLLEPEYHGDPIANEGILCFQHFGWDLLDRMRGLGFVDVAALLYWSEELGYLGREQVIFAARKPAPAQPWRRSSLAAR